MKINDIESTAYPLPSDILAEKAAGSFTAARELIRRRLDNSDTSDCMKKRLLHELSVLDMTEADYCRDRDEVISEIRRKVTDFSEKQFDELLLGGLVDYCYIDGRKRFLSTACDSLFNTYPQLFPALGDGWRTRARVEDSIVNTASAGDGFGAHICLRHTVELRPRADAASEVCHVHVPVPWKSAPNISSLKIRPSDASARFSPESAAMHTVYFEAPAKGGLKFSVEYEYDYKDTCVDMYNGVEPLKFISVPEAELAEYLADEPPHMHISPFIKAVAAEIIGDETAPLMKARAIYDYLTTKCHYRFTRNYSAIDNIPEWFLVNGHGDCGTMALAFITLCRSVGIPAGWNSGLFAGPDFVGNHDWAWVYVEGYGCRPVDVSFGGSANRVGNEPKRRFYFGNIDPFRAIFNSDVSCEFEPPKRFMRRDIVDSQDGEVEFDSRGAFADEYSVTIEDMGIKSF